MRSKMITYAPTRETEAYTEHATPEELKRIAIQERIYAVKYDDFLAWLDTQSDEKTWNACDAWGCPMYCFYSDMFPDSQLCMGASSVKIDLFWYQCGKQWVNAVSCAGLYHMTKSDIREIASSWLQWGE